MVARIGTTTRRHLLDGEQWELHFARRVDAPSRHFPEDNHAYATIPATVPGSVELDLMREGLLGDPFLQGNLEDAWELDHGDWWYRTRFEVPEGWARDGLHLVFSGLDTLADIHVNGTLVGSTATMMVEHELDVSDVARPGVNELVVHLRSPLLEAEKFDYPASLMQIWDSMESLWIRKPAHMYGWDIAPRLVSAGIFRSVELVERTSERICDWYMTTTAVGKDRADVEVHFELSRAPRGRNVQLRIDGVHPRTGKTFTATAHPTFSSGRVSIRVDAPELWLPRGHGSPELYDVTLTLFVEGTETDRHSTRWGLRQIGLDWTLAAGDDGRFRMLVNGTPVFIMGTNWVPLDAIHARDAERLPQALELLGESGCNAVRLWGGNLYEPDAFYDWCDENGVLVWQDFAFACARYPQEEPFLGAVRDEADSIIRRLRNHASLALWCGANETDDSFAEGGIDPWTDEITRVVLPKSVRTHDPRTPYIPCSPAHVPGSSDRAADPEQHLWGDRAAYKESFYTSTTAEFISEIGYHGMPAVSSQRRFLPDIPTADIPTHPVWKLHETSHRKHPNWYYSRNELLINQARLHLKGWEEDIEQLTLASQITQAESKKFFVEQARLARGTRWGLMWWNLLDPWPQISDAVVDYYFSPKLAFHYLRRSQQQVIMMATEAKGWSRDVRLANDSPTPVTATWRVESATHGRVLDAGTHTVAAHTDQTVSALPLAAAGDCYLFTWTAEHEAGVIQGGNHYTEGSAPLDFDTYTGLYLPRISALADGFDAEACWR